MKDSQILSTFHDMPRPARRRGEPLVFDACEIGVALRAVLFVEVVMAVGALWGAHSLLDWVGRLALATAAALSGTLLWLLVACSFKRALARLPRPAQYGAGVALGALAGGYGCGLLALAGLVAPAPWLASACSGALLAAGLVAALVWRVKGRTPAATTARLAELRETSYFATKIVPGRGGGYRSISGLLEQRHSRHKRLAGRIDPLP